MIKYVSSIVLIYAVWTAAGAGCPGGWTQHGDSCYHVGIDKKLWSEAMDICDEHGSHLINIETADEQEFLMNFLKRYGQSEYWLGASDWEVEDKWKWEPSGIPITFSQWYPGQPNNRDDDENCMSIYTTDYNGYEGKWFDEHCEEDLFYICEKRASDSFNQQSTSAIFPGQIVMGPATTVLPVVANTKVSNSRMTSTASTTQTIIGSTSCPMGWIQNRDSCYHIGFDEKRWSESMSACEEHGSHLINIETVEEQNFIVKYLSSHSDDPDVYWIGGSDWAKINLWIWEPEGKAITYSNWYPGQPNSLDGNENCLSLSTMQKEYGTWLGEHCEETLFYICEQRVPSPSTRMVSTTAATKMTPTTSTTAPITNTPKIMTTKVTSAKASTTSTPATITTTPNIETTTPLPVIIGR